MPEILIPTPGDATIWEMKRQLHDQLHELHRNYERAAAPIWAKLTELSNLEPRPMILVKVDDIDTATLEAMMKPGAIQRLK